MPLIFSLALAGSFTQLVNDTAEMRFCAAGSAVYADEARKRDGKDSDDGQFFDMVELKFKNRLTELDANDPVLFAREKATIAGPLGEYHGSPMISPDLPPVATRYSKCLNLVFGGLESEALTETAKVLDQDMAAAEKKLADTTPTTEIDFNPLEFMALGAASEARKSELRCAVNAAMLVKRKNANPTQNDWGMTDAKSDLLQRRVTEMLVIETGVSAKAVRVLIEDATSGDPSDAQDIDLAGCRPLFDSIDPTAGGGGMVAGLSALATADQPTAPLCYALLTQLAKEQTGNKTAAADSEKAAERIANDYMLRHADDPEMAGAAFGLALADLDRRTRIGTVDKDGEIRIAACRKMAAEIG